MLVHGSKSQTILREAAFALHLIDKRMKNRRGSIMSARASKAEIKTRKRRNQKQTRPKSFPPFVWKSAKDGPPRPEIQELPRIKYVRLGCATRPSRSSTLQICLQFEQLQVARGLGSFAPKSELKNERLLILSILTFGESQIGHCISVAPRRQTRSRFRARAEFRKPTTIGQSHR